MEPVREHSVDLEQPVATVVAAVERAAEAWGAEWEHDPGADGGRLHLPVAAGLRHGVVRGPLAVTRQGDGSRVSFRAEESSYWLQTSAVAILIFSALGALLTVIWPFFPDSEALLQVAPLGAVLAIGGWLLVVSRLTTRDVNDFLEMVGAAAAGELPEALSGTPGEDASPG